MAPKKENSFPFQGIPDYFYFDSGRIGRSPLIRKVLEDRFGSKVKVHLSDKVTGKLKKLQGLPFNTTNQQFPI